MKISYYRSFNLIHKKVQKVHENCDIENNQNVFDCTLSTFETRANCSFPWSMDQTKKKCSKKVVRNELQRSKGYEECQLDNCMKEYFKPELLMENYDFSSVVSFGQYSEEADVFEEYYLMDLPAFLSAVGGDLGLVIGAGILTLFELIIETCFDYFP